MMDNILEVKKLKISFRTNNGTVKAVRDISFDLHRGETLAIVGESGSGKSVTSKAILGISAGNAILDGGEILFDGKDLLRISEEEMYKIRGDKIAMIFQDPLSSLDPIVKIGKQITEAMILKNIDSRKNAKKEFNSKLAILKDNMIDALGKDKIDEINQIAKDFDGFNIVATKLEESYNASHALVEEVIAAIKDFTFKYEKKQELNFANEIKTYITKLSDVKDPYFLNIYKEGYATQIQKLKDVLASYKEASKDESKLADANNEVIKLFNELLAFLLSTLEGEIHNFFRIGFYKYKNPNEDLSEKDIHEVNEMTLQYLNDNFMLNFLKYEKEGIKNSFNKSLEGKKIVLEKLADFKEYLNTKNFTKAGFKEKADELKIAINASIDYLQIIKDSIAYTFGRSLDNDIDSYFFNQKNNIKEQKRFDRETAKYNNLVNKGKTPDWKVEPLKLVSLDDQIENILAIVNRLENKYTEDINNAANFDADKVSVDLIDFFKAKASELVYKVTKAIAKERAIKLMEEVGIPEPRIRYYQYPFEFSGGMRQRIVIAIALSANPDILICDEPTTALDVTIQSQILELINNLKKERNLSVIFITHDLGVVANMADRIAVMYAGKIVEIGNSEEVFYSPAHPYTWALLSSMPDLETKEKLEAIPGTPPNMIYPPVGDAFAARNKYALKIDFEQQPPLFKITDTHYAATWLLHPDAPKVEMPKIIVERINRMKEQGGVDDGNK